MSKVLFGVHGLRGSLNNSLALGQQLVTAGHNVVFAGFRDVARDVEAIGARFIHLQDGPRLASLVESTAHEKGIVRSLASGRRARNELLDLNEATNMLSSEAPELAVLDMEMHGLVLAAAALDTPVLLSVPFHDVYYAPSRPPMHTELGPPRSKRDTLRLWLAWQKLFVHRRARRLYRPLTRAGFAAQVRPFQLNTAEHHNVQTMAARLGVDLAAISSDRDWMHPVVYHHAPVMSFAVKELELDAVSTPNLTHVGPIINPHRPNHLLDASEVSELDAFLAAATAEGKMVAYCSMGSLQPASLPYYRSVVEAFADLDQWVLILGLGSQGDRLALNAGSDVLVMSEAPQLRILDHAKVALYPGGTGTFYECVRAGVPSIVIHTGHVDMPGVAARVDHHCLGQAISRDMATPAAIRDAVLAVTTKRCIESVQRAREVVVSYESRLAGLNLVEQTLANAHRRSSP